MRLPEKNPHWDWLWFKKLFDTHNFWNSYKYLFWVYKKNTKLCNFLQKTSVQFFYKIFFILIHYLTNSGPKCILMNRKFLGVPISVCRHNSVFSSVNNKKSPKYKNFHVCLKITENPMVRVLPQLLKKKTSWNIDQSFWFK